MNREQILATFRDLAQSQGLYGRILRDLANAKENDPEIYEATMKELEDQNFKDPVDLILFIES